MLTVGERPLRNARRGRELKRYYLVLRLNLASDLCARHLVFKEPPDLREPDQNIEIAGYVSSNFDRPALRQRQASWGVTTGVTGPRERTARLRRTRILRQGRGPSQALRHAFFTLLQFPGRSPSTARAWRRYATSMRNRTNRAAPT